MNKDDPSMTPSEISLTSWGALACSVVIVILLYHWRDWNAGLATVVGGLLGWLLGIMLSPFEPEKALFAGYAKAASAFATGFLVSKLDRVFELIIGKSANDQSRLLSTEVWRHIVFFVCGLLLMTIYVFTCRHYGQRASAAEAAKATAI